MAEWSNAAVLKTAEPETVPGVRIPLLPPLLLCLKLIFLLAIKKLHAKKFLYVQFCTVIWVLYIF